MNENVCLSIYLHKVDEYRTAMAVVKPIHYYTFIIVQIKKMYWWKVISEKEKDFNQGDGGLKLIVK